MSETQAKRPPPVAPKPTFISLERIKSNLTPHQSHSPPSTGALLAATVAGKKQSSPPKSPFLAAPGRSHSPNRGRALRHQDVGHSANNSSGLLAPAPMLARSVSALAARYASANTSPVRGSASDTKTTKDNLTARGRQETNALSSGTLRPTHRSHIASSELVSSPPSIKPSDHVAYGDETPRAIANLTTPPLSLTPSTSLTNVSSGGDAGHSLGRHMLAGTMRKLDRSISQDIHTPAGAIAARGRTAEIKQVMNSLSETHSAPNTSPIPIEGGHAQNRSEDSVPPYHHSVSGSGRGSLTASTLADAMVASSLASSRTPSPPKKGVKQLPSRRRSRSLGGLDNNIPLKKPPPLPAPRAVRPMKHTLRQESPDKESDNAPARRGRRHWVRKHPNKHHEGDRKRWRDRVTDQEKKRYEGVWAANRGLLMDYDLYTADSVASTRSAPSKELVTNVVVRDIWNRCRLPREVLEEIWDLVAPGSEKALTKDEFVVGLWLIDQRLKGRKLPFKVSASVWSSVRHLQGVKIHSKKIQ